MKTTSTVYTLSFLWCCTGALTGLFAQVPRGQFYYAMQAGEWEDAPLELAGKSDSVLAIVNCRIRGLKFKANDVKLKPHEEINAEYRLRLRANVQYYLTIEKDDFQGLRIGPVSFEFSKRIRIEAIDIEPPVILSKNFRCDWSNERIKISVPVESLDSLRSVELFYRQGNDTSYSIAPMRNLSASIYGAEITASQKQMIEIYIKAYGRGDVYSIWPESNEPPYRVLFRPDSIPPSIQHFPNQSAIKRDGRKLELKARVSDDSGIERVEVHYKKFRQTEDKTTLMTREANDLFATLIENVPDTLEYYIRATDLEGKADVAPGDGTTFKFVYGARAEPDEQPRGFWDRYKWFIIGGGTAVISTVAALIIIDGPPNETSSAERLPDPPGKP